MVCKIKNEKKLWKLLKNRTYLEVTKCEHCDGLIAIDKIENLWKFRGEQIGLRNKQMYGMTYCPWCDKCVYIEIES